MRRVHATLLACVAVAMLVGCEAASAVTYPAGFTEEKLATGLNFPTAVARTPDGRLLIVEKWGVLKAVAPGSTTPVRILNFETRVNGAGDRGALGLAVDANYATNNYVYLLYSAEVSPLTPDQDGPMVSQLLRIKVSPANVVSDQTVILGSHTSGPCPAPSNTVDCIPSDSNSHSIGSVRAAPDGTLYVGTGDGSDYNAADPRALRAYDERALSGKIMRIDRNGNGVGGHPFCPTDTDLSHNCTKVWAKGLRNPFRFYQRPNGGLTIGDVGWSTTEEVDLAPAGGGRSFGWPCYEGPARTPDYQDMAACQAEYAKPAGTHTAPDYSYCHCSTYTGSVMGGPEYTGSRYPAGFKGSIFIGDYSNGFLKRLEPQTGGGWVARAFATGWLGVDLEQDANGDLVYLSPGDFSTTGGAVVALRYTSGNQPPTARITSDKTSGVTPLAVAFDGRTSSDPDGDALTYRWAFGDGTTSTSPNPSKTYTSPGTYTVTLTVSDGDGATGSTTLKITAGNSAPTATITAPADESSFRDGQTVQLRATATDAQDGTLPSSSLTWRILLHHGQHVHGFNDLTGAQQSFVTRDDHDADSYYEITLTARDSGGLTATKTIQIRPETVPLKLDSVPAGAPITWAGATLTAPHTAPAAIGFKTTVAAADRFSKDGKSYVFTGWSDGGARSHAVTVGTSALTLTANYKPDASSGPVVALGFDEPSGTTAADKSGRGNNATLGNGAAFSRAGRNAGGLALDGVDDWATIADASSLDLTGPMTLEAWVKPRSRAGWDTVLEKEKPDGLAYALYSAADPLDGSGTGGEPVGFTGDVDLRGPKSLPLNTWSHLAMTNGGGVQRIFVDGTLVASANVAATAPASTGVLRIGGNSVWGEHFDGIVDDVRVYDRALYTNEIVRDRDLPVGATAPPAAPAPVAAYGFEETSGTTTADASSAHATAQIDGATRIASGKIGRALTFDGVNDRVTAPDAEQLRLGGPMTISAWVKPTSTTGWRTVLMKEQADGLSYALYGAADPWDGTGLPGEPLGFFGPTTIRGKAKLPLNAWSHVAMTFDGTRERFYLNGIGVAGTDVTTPPEFDGGPLTIGGNAVWGEWFAGAIDEVRLFDRGLSSAQLLADMDRAGG